MIKDNFNKIIQILISLSYIIAVLACNSLAAPTYQPQNTPSAIPTVAPNATATETQTPYMSHDSTVRSIAFSPDGTMLVSGGDDNNAYVWDFTTHKRIAQMAYDKEVSSVAFSPNGKWVASGSWDGTTRVWDPKTGQEISRMTVDGGAKSVEFSADSKWIAQAACEGFSEGFVACGKSIVRIWEASTGQQLYKLKPGFGVGSVKFTPDGKNILMSGNHGSIQLWNLDSGTESVSFQPELGSSQKYGMLGSYINSIDIDHSGRWLVDATIVATQVWDLKTGQEVCRMLHGANSVAFSMDGKLIVSGGDDIRIWNAETGEIIKQIPINTTTGNIRAIVFSPDGKLLAGASGNIIKIWDSATGQEISEIP